MTTHLNASPAPYGLYLSMRPLDVRFVGADGETLEGIAGASYWRLPLLLLLAAAPVLGGLFVVAFPVLVVVATVAGVAKLVSDRVKAVAERHAWLARARFAPDAAYLNGEKAEPKAPAAGEAEGLADLKGEVEARRSEEKSQEKSADQTTR